jgi:hypothetical protein
VWKWKKSSDGSMTICLNRMADQIYSKYTNCTHIRGNPVHCLNQTCKKEIPVPSLSPQFISLECFLFHTFADTFRKLFLKIFGIDSAMNCINNHRVLLM